MPPDFIDLTADDEDEEDDGRPSLGQNPFGTPTTQAASSASSSAIPPATLVGPSPRIQTPNSEIFAAYLERNKSDSQVHGNAQSKMRVTGHHVGTQEARLLSQQAMLLSSQAQYTAGLPLIKTDRVTSPIVQPSTEGHPAMSLRKRYATGQLKYSGHDSTNSSSRSPSINITLESNTPNASLLTLAQADPTQSQFGIPFTPEDDLRLIHLKEDLDLSWDEIARHFPGRSRYSVQTRYSRKLIGSGASKRVRRSRRKRSSSSSSLGVAYPVDQTEYIMPDGRPLNRQMSSQSGRQKPYTMQEIVMVDTEPEYLSDADADVVVSHPSNCAVATTAKKAVPKNTPKEEKLPYLSFEERRLLRDTMDDQRWDANQGQAWQGTTTHLDLYPNELHVMEKSARKILNKPKVDSSSRPLRRIKRLIKGATEDQLYAIAGEAKRKLPRRSIQSIRAFLLDASRGTCNLVQSVERVGPVQKKAFQPPYSEINAFLRRRELGAPLARGCQRPSNILSTRVTNSGFSTMGPSFTYTGTSGDVNVMAWSPDGLRFVVGSASPSDEDSMQYNRPKNLLLGDMVKKSLLELPDHHTMRPITSSGANSSSAMFASQDPRLFSTISAVAFSPDGTKMYSTGFQDRVLRVWDMDGDKPQKQQRITHKGPIDVLSVSCTGAVATGCRRYAQSGGKGNSIKVIKFHESTDQRLVYSTYSSERADSRPDYETAPSTLKFEPTFGNLLLAGFSSYAEGIDREYGDICLWDVETKERFKVNGSARHCFDASWSTIRPYWFAVGSIATGLNIGKDCRTVVRIYQYQQQSHGWGSIMELESPALDINDVVFCPYDANYIAAGCTDGRTYVWDMRRPDDYLFSLNHRESLQPLDEGRPWEEVDTGIRFCAWGENRTRLYTGSSDGVVKLWDVTKSASDTHIKDVVSLSTGVMSGAFSPDYSSLLIGEVGGTINLLEVGKEDVLAKDMEKFEIIEAPIPKGVTGTNTVSGTSLSPAQELIQTGQIAIKPAGWFPKKQAVQGPNYAGPWDTSADASLHRLEASDLQDTLHAATVGSCPVPGCSDATSKMTFEEQGPSKRSEDRIPDSLRLAFRPKPVSKMAEALGKCKVCGGPARPRELESGEQLLLCEKCHFSCFRCGERAVVSQAVDLVRCFKCGIEWEIGALGYGEGRKMKGKAKATGPEELWNNVGKDKCVKSCMDDVVYRWKEDSAPLDLANLDRESFAEEANIDDLNQIDSYYNSRWELPQICEPR